MTLRVLTLTCTLKPSPAKSSGDLIARRATRTAPYQDLDEPPEAVASTNATLVRNAVHLANLLRA
ncbi:hypothetical protein AB0C38_17640 [Amycolatopsis sp. NPDC048633]|uniref:hypothetical protein n=1 Tax=Amycolatopsis sp. NPDC048633 TaxID=3157095 RepID=UPI0033C16835